jgi:hypothetical protein
MLTHICRWRRVPAVLTACLSCCRRPSRPWAGDLGLASHVGSSILRGRLVDAWAEPTSWASTGVWGVRRLSLANVNGAGIRSVFGLSVRPLIV